MRNFNYLGKLFIASVAMVMSFNGCLCSASFQPKEPSVGYTYTTGGGCKYVVNDHGGVTMVDATNLKLNPDGSYSVSFLSSPYGKSKYSSPNVVHAMYVTAIEPNAFDGFNQRFINAGKNPPKVIVPSEVMPGPDAGWKFPENIVGD